MKLSHAVAPFLLVLTLVASGCSGHCPYGPDAELVQDIEFASVHDERVNFSALKTFAWAGNLGMVVDASGQWRAPAFDVQNELDFLIERELRDRGLVAVRTDPDVFVAYAVLVEVPEPTEEEREAGVAFENLQEGALMVQLVNGETLTPIWRSAAIAKGAEGRTDEQIRERLAYAIHRIFAAYPD